MVDDQQGEQVTSRAHAQEVVEGMRPGLGPEHPTVAEMMARAGDLARNRSEFAGARASSAALAESLEDSGTARPLNEKALTIRFDRLGKNDPGTIASIERPGKLARNQKRLADARTLFEAMILTVPNRIGTGRQTSTSTRTSIIGVSASGATARKVS